MQTRRSSCGVFLRLYLAESLAVVAFATMLPLGGRAQIQSGIQSQLPSQDPFLAALNAGNAKGSQKKDKAKHPAAVQGPQPAITIPATPLGFSAPAAFYLGDRFAQASLDFLDEDNLLFTFRVPGLMHREPSTPGQSPMDQRHIHAMTLSLPSGKVTGEAMWVLHDYSRYLWKMKDGRFLLRDRNLLQMGDASLHLEPFLRFPGPVTFIEFDPGQHLLIADTNEPSQSGKARNSPGSSGPGDDGPNSWDAQTASLSSSPASSATMNVDGVQGSGGSGASQDFGMSRPQPESESLVRILRMDTRKVMLFSRVNGSVHLPVDGEGYYDALRGNGISWLINYENFTGATNPIGWVDSTCNPALQVLREGIVLASACTESGARHLTALDRDRDKEHSRLWDVQLPPTKVWPILETSGDGLRVARETLEVSHPIGPYNPLDDSDIRGQSVQVYDVATGKVALTVPASPILDGGGNFALSPSGKRFAVLNAGAIQIYDLSPPPPMPAQPNAPPPVLVRKQDAAPAKP